LPYPSQLTFRGQRLRPFYKTLHGKTTGAREEGIQLHGGETLLITLMFTDALLANNAISFSGETDLLYVVLGGLESSYLAALLISRLSLDH